MFGVSRASLASRLALFFLLILSGTVFAAPQLNLVSTYQIASGTTTTSFLTHTDLGAVAVGSTSAKSTFNVYNAGSDILTVTGISVSNPAFKVTKSALTPLSLGAGDSFQISFNPTTNGLQTGIVTLVSNDPAKPNYTFAIQAVGGLPKIRITGNGIDLPNPSNTPSLETGTDFGPLTYTIKVIHDFVIHNDGDGDLTLNFGRATGGFNLAEAAPTVVPAFSSAVLKVSFTGTNSSTPSVGTVTLSSNDPAAPSSVITFSGSGLIPEMVVGGRGVTIAAGSVATKEADGTRMGATTLALGDLTSVYTIDNTGPGFLLLKDITWNDPDHFTVTTIPAGLTQVAPGARAYLQVVFHPDALGSFTDTVRLTTNYDPSAYFEFNVSATVQSANLQVGGIVSGDIYPDASDGTDFGGVLIGSGGLTRNFALTNSGPGQLRIQSITVSPSTAFKTGATSKLLLNGGETVQLPITFDPTARESSTATVTIQPVGQVPFTFAVKGLGLSSSLVAGKESAVIARNDLTPSVPKGTDFGVRLLAQGPADYRIPLRNTGNAPLTITRFYSSNAGEFIPTTGSGSPVTIPAGGSLDLVVRFMPEGLGRRESTLTIKSNDLGGDYVFALAATALAHVDSPDTPLTPVPLTPIPLSPSSAGTFVGMFTNSDFVLPVTHGGFESFRLGTNGAFTAKGDLNGQTLTLKGKFNADGTWQGTQKLADGTVVTIALSTFSGADGSVLLTGSVEHDGVTSQVSLIRAGQVSLPAGMAGSYTFIIPAEDNSQPNVPQGDGVGTLTLAANGTIRAKIVLADGTSVTRTGLLSPGHRWQVHFAPYGNSYAKGSLSGELVFRDVPGVSDLDGTLHWEHAEAAKTKLYPYEFGIDRGVVGSKYSAPSRGTATLPGVGTSGAVTLTTGPSLEHSDLTATALSWSAADKITVAAAPASKFTVNRATGLVTGTLVDPATKVKTSVSAVVLQKQSLASGFYKDTASSGFVLFEAGAN